MASSARNGEMTIFRNLDRNVEKLRWADFRTGINGKSKDWLAKLYGHERVLKLKKREKVDVTATGFREILDYEAEDYNTVLVVRWNHPGLLEIRIDQTGLQKAGLAEERLAAVWDLLSSALKESECRPWDLRKSITKMLQSRVKNAELYELGTVKMLDGAHGNVQFDPYKATESIDGDTGRTIAIDGLLANKAQGTGAAISWKPHEDIESLEKSLLTAITGEAFNCLAITSKTSSEIIDYVTNKLREFSK